MSDKAVREISNAKIEIGLRIVDSPGGEKLSQNEIKGFLASDLTLNVLVAALLYGRWGRSCGFLSEEVRNRIVEGLKNPGNFPGESMISQCIFELERIGEIADLIENNKVLRLIRLITNPVC
jgi:hypothetical protein